MKNSIAFRASTVWNLLTQDLAKTSNVKNYTRMASKSEKLRNLGFQAFSVIPLLRGNSDALNQSNLLNFSTYIINKEKRAKLSV